MDRQMQAGQTNEQQMEQTEPRVDAEHPPKKPLGGAIGYQPSFRTLPASSDYSLIGVFARTGEID
jgi:hypothetical protein